MLTKYIKGVLWGSSGTSVLYIECMVMSVITATVDLVSIFALSISGIFILTFCPRVSFFKFLEEVALFFFACSSSPSLAASRNTFTFWALLIVAVVPSGVLEIASESIFWFWTSVSTSTVPQVSVSLVLSLPCNCKTRVGSWSVFGFHRIMQDKWPPKYFKLTCSMDN